MPTQIKKRQIADGAIDNSKVQAGAGIETSKLADGGNFLKKDGSVAMNGNLNMGNQAIVNVATGSNPGDAVNKGQLDAAIAVFVDREIPSGAIDGSNTVYVLANTPILGSEHVYVNGILVEPGGGNDYTISGTTITTLEPLAAGEKIRVSYRK